MTIQVKESGGIITVTCGDESVEVAGYLVKPTSASSNDDDPGLGSTPDPSVFSVYLFVPDMKGLPYMVDRCQPAMDQVIKSASFKTLLHSTKENPFVFVVKPGALEDTSGGLDFKISSEVKFE